MSDPEIVMSPLCREIGGDGTEIQIDIYRVEDDSGWILEVIDEENGSSVWDDTFDTDQEAFNSAVTFQASHCVICYILLIAMSNYRDLDISATSRFALKVFDEEHE